jgi:CRISPR-associated endonuclease/helicase Cas3
MSRGFTRSERLEEMKRLYVMQAFSDIEMAKRLDVDRTTVFKDRRDLEGEYPFVQDTDARWRIDKKRYISAIKFNLHEALALYLAARRASRQTRISQPHVANAIQKLAAALRQPMTERLVMAGEAVLEQSAQPERVKVLEAIAEGWVSQQKVRITHQGLRARQAQTHLISPYLIEPSLLGDGTYLIGYSDVFNDVATFKVERIERAIVTGEPFTLPQDFDEQKLLQHTWGIWYGEGEPVTVKLHFFGEQVTRRVKETIWHPSQRPIEDTPDGCIWTAEVAEWREMVPWVRGWGASVEVLEPVELRKAIEEEVQKLARLYRVRDVKPKDDLIAHRRERDGEEQSLITHLIEASQLAENFAAKVGLPEIGKIMGLLHDFGKASDKFQGYLRSKQGLISPDEDGYVDAQRGEVDHSTAGAQLIYRKLSSRGREGRFLAQFLALAIASHHSGLINCLKPSGENEFERRITKDDKDTRLTEAISKLPEIERQLDEIIAQPIEQRFFKKILDEMKEQNDSQSTLPFKHGLLARFLLSCLLEADRLNTADFENPGNEVIRNYGKYLPWKILIERLEAKFAEFAQKTAQMEVGSRAWEVNQLRTQVAQACLDAAAKPKDIYQLTVPTGGGKTLASLRFAMHHAQAHKMDRVFYIVPYITIIDQNAGDVRKILEKADERDKVVLEHHSNLTPEKETRRHNLLAENWDAPIVFTTQVQFLEALFGSGTRDARRMHQLANSVIILDEVQTVPIRIVHMLNTALRFLTHDCGATVVLCTATQPPLNKLPENPYRALTVHPEQKIIQNEAELFEKLKRVEVHDERKPGGLPNTEIGDLAERALQEKGSVLIVVNTRASAQALYQEINTRGLETTYHLSTNMCPAHRVDVLNEVRAKLNAEEPVICVSTQLIEAGVDIDFGAVIRALAGLDSLAQSAGRCNRHGVREGLGSVWVVNPHEENLDRLVDIKIGRGHAQRVLDDFRDNPEPFGSDRIGLNAIAAYYNFYYQSRKDEMNYPVKANSPVGRSDDLFSLLSQNTLSTDAYKGIHRSAPEILLRQSFQSAAREFHVIDSPTRGVVVPYKEGDEIIKDLCGAFALEKQGKLLKQAQRYSVNLFAYQFDNLVKAGAINEVQEGTGIYYLDSQYYSEEFGWSDKPVGDMKVLIVGEQRRSRCNIKTV